MIYISSDAKLDGDSIYEKGFFISGHILAITYLVIFDEYDQKCVG